MPDTAKSKSEAAAAPGLSGKDLAWLVCPVCRSALELLEIQTGASRVIRCIGCDRRYPLADGLPVLLADRAALASATKV